MTQYDDLQFNMSSVPQDVLDDVTDRLELLVEDYGGWL